jgi:hypothetical protein
MTDRLGQQYQFLRHYLTAELGNHNRNNELCSQLYLHSYHYRNLGSVVLELVIVAKVDRLVAVVVRTEPAEVLHTAAVVLIAEVFDHLIYLPTSYYSSISSMFINPVGAEVGLII